MVPRLVAVALSALVASAALVPATASEEARPDIRNAQIPVACAKLKTLRDLADDLVLMENPRTGDTFSYVVVGDAAVSSDLLVMFNGTGGILPDWPMQMITNSTYSPKITATNAYVPSEDGPISLCHDYRLVLFDYPGVGGGVLAGSYTSDRIADDVDAMLDDIAVRYGIPTDVVNPFGWSLGTELALKYAFLSPASNKARTIDNIVLIATRPGGNTDGFQDGNQAQCLSFMLGELETEPPGTTLYNSMRDASYELTFPFVGQRPYDGVHSGCRASIRGGALNLKVTPDCPVGSLCAKNFVDEAANRQVQPWKATSGVDQALYTAERNSSHDYNICYCQVAGAGFTSKRCSCSDTVITSKRNGGVCRTVSTGVTKPSRPISTDCVPLEFRGKLTVINGREDLFIQWTYGRALVEGMQATLGDSKARLVTYSGEGGAGHGILLQYPKWTQRQISRALRGSAESGQ